MANSFYQPQRSCYATAKQVKALLGNTVAATGQVIDNINDDIVVYLAEAASQKIDEFCAPRVFYPYYKSSIFDWPGTSFELPFRDDLLSLTNIINGDGTSIPPTTVVANSTLSSYFLYPADTLPKYKVVLNIAVGRVFLFIGTPQQAIQVQGIWGYPDNEVLKRWYVNSGATVQDIGGQTIGATTLTVQPGIFQVGQTIYIDSELELVQNVAAGATSDILTVQRAANGTTATAHTNGAVVYRVTHHPVITRACYRLAAYYYRQKDSADFGKLQVGTPMFGMIELPQEIPADIAGDLLPLARINI